MTSPLSCEEYRILCSRIMLEYQVGNFSQGSVFMERLLELLRGYAAPQLETTVHQHIHSNSSRCAH